MLFLGSLYITVAYPGGCSGCWSTPISSGTIASSVAQWQILLLIIDDWKLLPTINLLASKIRSQSSSLILIAIWPKTAFFISQLPSRTRLIRGVVNVLGAWLQFFVRALCLSKCLSTPPQILGTSLHNKIHNHNHYTSLRLLFSIIIYLLMSTYSWSRRAILEIFFICMLEKFMLSPISQVFTLLHYYWSFMIPMLLKKQA